MQVFGQKLRCARLFFYSSGNAEEEMDVLAHVCNFLSLSPFADALRFGRTRAEQRNIRGPSKARSACKRCAHEHLLHSINALQPRSRRTVAPCFFLSRGDPHVEFEIFLEKKSRYDEHELKLIDS
jgi:hypothetical protein